MFIVNGYARRGGPCGRPIVLSITEHLRAATRAAPTVIPCYPIFLLIAALNNSSRFTVVSSSSSLRFMMAALP